MVRHFLNRELDREFVTIYFLQADQEERRVAVRRIWFILSIVFLLFGLTSLKVWQEMQVVKLGYRINQERQQYHQLLDEHRALQTQRNALASLERIEVMAKAELGLETPRSEQLVFLVDPAAANQRLQPWFNWMRGMQQWVKRIAKK